MFNWIRSWWITWRVWRNADAEQRRIMTRPRPFDPDNFIEVERPWQDPWPDENAERGQK